MENFVGWGAGSWGDDGWGSSIDSWVAEWGELPGDADELVRVLCCLCFESSSERTDIVCIQIVGGVNAFVDRLSDAELLPTLHTLDLRITYPDLGRACACDPTYHARLGRAEQSLHRALVRRRSTLKHVGLRSVGATKDRMAFPTPFLLNCLERDGLAVSLFDW